MTPARIAVASAVTLATALADLACSSSLDPETGQLIGRWVTAREELNPRGWHQYHLTFNGNGAYRSEVRMYGLYTGQAAAELSAFSREEGLFREEGDSLFMEARRLVAWDRFYGADSPERVYEPYPYGDAPLDGARLEFRGDRLTLYYITYPADAPVPTTQEYARVP